MQVSKTKYVLKYKNGDFVGIHAEFPCSRKTIDFAYLWNDESNAKAWLEIFQEQEGSDLFENRVFKVDITYSLE